MSDRYDVRGSEVYATPSIGIAIYPGAGETAERLIKGADLAMYQANHSILPLREDDANIQMYDVSYNFV